MHISVISVVHAVNNQMTSVTTLVFPRRFFNAGHSCPDSTIPVAQRWAPGGSTIGPPLAATGGGPTSFWPVGQRWPNSGMPLLGPPVGHRWANISGTVGMWHASWATNISANISATVGANE